METMAITLNEEESMRLEGIFMDQVKEEALRFLLEVIKPEVMSKGSPALDSK